MQPCRPQPQTSCQRLRLRSPVAARAPTREESYAAALGDFLPKKPTSAADAPTDAGGPSKLDELRMMEAEHMRLMGIAADKKASAKAKQDAADALLAAAKHAAEAAERARASDAPSACSSAVQAVAERGAGAVKRRRVGVKTKAPADDHPAPRAAAPVKAAAPTPAEGAALPAMPKAGTSAKYLGGKILSSDKVQKWRVWPVSNVPSQEFKVPYGKSKAESFKVALKLIRSKIGSAK